MYFKKVFLILLVTLVVKSSCRASEEITKIAESTVNNNEDEKPRVWKDYSYIAKTKRFYKVHNTPKTWREAAKTCKNEGAILYHPENNKELMLVKNWWKECRDGAACLSDSAEIHVGLTDEETEGKFKTIDGLPISQVFNKWQKGQPDNSDHGVEEDCVMLRTHEDHLHLNDINCDGKAPMTRYPFVCKQELNWKTVCDKIEDSDYKYIEKTNKFYKIYKDAKSWLEAEQVCKNEGAILFHPGSARELNVVKSWWKDCKHGAECLSENAAILVGITDDDDEGNFKTVNGIPLNDVYHKWQEGQPDNDNQGWKENCGMLNSNNTLNDINCYGIVPLSKHPYICTKECPSKDSVICKIPDTKKNFKKWRDYIYKPEMDSFYKIHAQKKSWLDAKAQCESEDALLFYPDDAAEAQMIRTWWGHVFPIADMTPREFPFMHIGITNLNSSTGYVTVDGKPLEDVYHKWGPGEPNNSGGVEHCGTLCYNLAVNDVKCDGKDSDFQSNWFYLPYICKKAVKSNNIETNYQHSSKTKSCYSLQLEPLNWKDAEAACANDNAHLALINSAEEAEFLAKMVAEAPLDQVTGDFLRGAVHLGFRFNQGYWETIRGDLLSSVRYVNWGYLQPDGQGKENCGSMFHSGKLNDISCDAKAFYICEKDYEYLSK